VKLYETYSYNVIKTKEKTKSRRSIPHSTTKDNPEGLLEIQLKNREQSESGVRAKFKKRHLKQLPIEVRENIVKMYLEDHIYQKEIAKLYKISTALVSKLVREAQEESTRNADLRKKEAKEREEVEAIKQNVKDM